MGENTQLALLVTWIGSVLAVLMAFIWVALRLGPKGRGHGQGHTAAGDELFSDEFRDRLRERGVARFEHTVDQNAAYLQQDIHKVTEEVSDYIKEQVGEILREQLSDQKQSVAAAQEHLTEAFTRIDQSLTTYHKTMTEQLQKELTAEKERRLAKFQDNMAEVVTHYIAETLGSQMEVGEQVKYIVTNLEANKQAIIEDIKHEL